MSGQGLALGGYLLQATGTDTVLVAGSGGGGRLIRSELHDVSILKSSPW